MTVGGAAFGEHLTKKGSLFLNQGVTLRGAAFGEHLTEKGTLLSKPGKGNNSRGSQTVVGGLNSAEEPGTLTNTARIPQCKHCLGKYI